MTAVILSSFLADHQISSNSAKFKVLMVKYLFFKQSLGNFLSKIVEPLWITASNS